jgi:hypothetical protein
MFSWSVQRWGQLVGIDIDYGLDAFVIRSDLLQFRQLWHAMPTFEDCCLVHARMEPDWQKYSKVGIILTWQKSGLCIVAIWFWLILMVMLMLDTCDIGETKHWRDSHCCVRSSDRSEDRLSIVQYDQQAGLRYIQAADIDFHLGVMCNLNFPTLSSSWKTLHLTLRRLLHANPGAKIEVGAKRLIKGNAQKHCVAYDQMANRNKSMS